MKGIDPQTLIDLPGAGNAEKALRKAGLWDKYAGLPEKEYSVKVEYRVIVDEDEWVKVKARHEDEAAEKAMDYIEDDDDVIDDSAEVTKIKELSK